MNPADPFFEPMFQLAATGADGKKMNAKPYKTTSYLSDVNEDHPGLISIFGAGGPRR